MAAREEFAAASNWMNRRNALKHFAEFEGPTQGQEHIRPLHEYVTSRLVLEGGFQPEELTPRPPLRVERIGNIHEIIYDPDEATRSEATILGGLKTKNVDIVVTKEGIGPVLAISCKGMTGAVRNLTNRLEETIGECTNIHIGYPALVFGYLFVIRANQEAEGIARTDAAIDESGQPVDAIIRFHHALSAMSGRSGIRDDPSGYESIAMAMVEVQSGRSGSLFSEFPPGDSPIHFDHFFETLYRRYDERFVVSAPQLARSTRRREWSVDFAEEEPSLFEAVDYCVRTKDP